VAWAWSVSPRVAAKQQTKPDSALAPRRQPEKKRVFGRVFFRPSPVDRCISYTTLRPASQTKFANEICNKESLFDNLISCEKTLCLAADFLDIEVWKLLNLFRIMKFCYPATLEKNQQFLRNKVIIFLRK
jgi:hypothetical protein